MPECDWISALPDELLHHVLSFLTATEAVQTCVLSRRWQNVWASVKRLNVDATSFTTLEQFTKFVDSLLLQRDSTPLDMLWLRIILDSSDTCYFSDYSQIHRWVCHALRSDARTLGIVQDDEAETLTIHSAFTSLHLKRLHLCNFHIDDLFVKKLSSGCPALEELELIKCEIFVTEFSSTTLKRLTVNNPPYRDCPGEFSDLVIDMPNLVSLYIKELPDRNPYLMDVSSLETALIFIDDFSFIDSDVDCNALSALSNVTSLESFSLSVHRDSTIQVFVRDALRCGTFSNLTTLTLGEWCLSNGCSMLLYLLRRSPKIQKLILNLTTYGASMYDTPEQDAAEETHPASNETETPLKCKNLKKIEINCPLRDRRVHTVARALFASLTSTPEINIKPSKCQHERYW